MGFRTLDLDDENQAQEYKKSKRHNKFVKENKVEAAEVKKDETEVEKPAEETVEVKNGAPIMYGKVIKIDKLRIRREPEGDVIGYALKDEEVEILEDLDDQWYKITTKNGTTGCCMKTFLLTYSDVVGVNDNRRCKPCPRVL